MKIEVTGTPLEFAKSSTKTELKKLIKESLKGEYDEFSDRCRICFQYYMAGDLERAAWWSNHAELVRG